MIQAIIFLGNPGAEYAGNRHNAGRLLLQHLPVSPAWQRKFKGLYSKTAWPGGVTLKTEPPGQETTLADTVHLLQPETFMNLSGEAAQALAAFYKIAPEEILVVHDELELPLGQCRFKFGGGLGGHNGLRSLKACLGTADFWRLRLGIGRPAHPDVAGYVLSDFAPDERPLLDEALTRAAAALWGGPLPPGGASA